MLGMALCRYVLAFPPLAALTSEEVVEAIGPAVHRHLCLGA
ncbi:MULTISPECIES: TetR/AcrR family transcriptional regulator [unclassified Nonomuraea]